MPNLKINILLSALQMTHKDIAIAIGVTPPAVTMAINGRRKSRQMRELIASCIREHITPESLFDQSPEPLPAARQTAGKRGRNKRGVSEF